MMMVRMMCGMTLKHRLSNQELLERMGIESVSNVIRISRLSWFGHIERLPAVDWVSRSRILVC